MKELIDSFITEIHGKQVAVRVFKTNISYVVGCRDVLGDNELVREYPLNADAPLEERIQQDFSDDFRSKKVLFADDPFIDEALDRAESKEPHRGNRRDASSQD